MNYFSTRDAGKKEGKPSAYVIKQGIAPDGGLYVPDSIPVLSKESVSALVKKSYADRAAFILGLFLTDFTAAELTEAAKSAYSRSGFPDKPVRLTQINGEYILELWHGPTSAFKDMALQLMPKLLSLSLEKTGEKKDALILVATSGDTGKAALEGFADAERIKIQVFYPRDGISDIQKKQMECQHGKNVAVTAVNGNFDDAQNGVKEIFADAVFAAGLAERNLFLSSANSINWGRLAPQIVYYVSAYCELIASKQIKYGEKINFAVPTGNFGNILAGWFAKKMGLPINKLICASNSNDVLTEFIKTGVYDRNRRFRTTISPSMDILISSNLERLLYFTAGAENCRSYMAELNKTGKYEVAPGVLAAIKADFEGFCCDETQTEKTISKYFVGFDYLPDPHTAVGLYCAEEYRLASGDNTKTVCVSTASPYKFAPAALGAIGLNVPDDGFEALEKLSEISDTEIPPRLSALKNKSERFFETVDRSNMRAAVLEFIEKP